MLATLPNIYICQDLESGRQFQGGQGGHFPTLATLPLGGSPNGTPRLRDQTRWGSQLARCPLGGFLAPYSSRKVAVLRGIHPTAAVHRRQVRRTVKSSSRRHRQRDAARAREGVRSSLRLGFVGWWWRHWRCFASAYP